MRRRHLVLIGLLGLAASLAYTPMVSAQAFDLKTLVEKLRASKDFRVRTQAALALGASKSKRAITPLCRGLADDNTTVRVAAAAALGRLKRGGAKCVQRRLGVEKEDQVREALARALGLLRPAAPKLTEETRWLIAVGETKQVGSTASPDGKRKLDRALRKHLAESRETALVPIGMSPAGGGALLRGHPDVKGLMLLPQIEVDGAGGTLTIRLEVSLFSYPDQVLLGSVRKKLAMPDTPVSDLESLNELVEMAAQNLADDVRKTAAKL